MAGFAHVVSVSALIDVAHLHVSHTDSHMMHEYTLEHTATQNIFTQDIHLDTVTRCVFDTNITLPLVYCRRGSQSSALHHRERRTYLLPLRVEVESKIERAKKKLLFYEKINGACSNGEPISIQCCGKEYGQLTSRPHGHDRREALCVNDPACWKSTPVHSHHHGGPRLTPPHLLSLTLAFSVIINDFTICMCLALLKFWRNRQFFGQVQ